MFDYFLTAKWIMKRAKVPSKFNFYCICHQHPNAFFSAWDRSGTNFHFSFYSEAYNSSSFPVCQPGFDVESKIDSGIGWESSE